MDQSPINTTALDADAMQHLQGLSQDQYDALVRAILRQGAFVADTAPPPPPPPPPPVSPSQPSPSWSYASSVQSHQQRASISTISTTRTASTLLSQPSTLSSCTSARSESLKRFWCTSCDTGFKLKHDWWHHEEKYHEPWKVYPCPECNSTFSHANDFNKHHRKAHRCVTCPHAEKVEKVIKVRTGWGCGFCSAFSTNQRRHLEHVANEHYAKGKTKAHWTHANVIYGLLHQPKVHECWLAIVKAQAGQVLPHGQKPYFCWNDRKTGRAHGFIEGLCEGNLQDQLEFFNPKVDDAATLAKLAFDLADKMSYPRNYVSGNLSPQLNLSKPLPAAPGSPLPGATFTIRGIAGGTGDRENSMMSDSMAELPHIVSAAMGGGCLEIVEDIMVPARTPLSLDGDVYDPLAEIESRQAVLQVQHGGVELTGLDVTLQDFSNRLPSAMREDGWLASETFMMG